MTKQSCIYSYLHNDNVLVKAITDHTSLRPKFALGDTYS